MWPTIPNIAWLVAIAFYRWSGGAEDSGRASAHERLALAATLPDDRLVRLYQLARPVAAAAGAKRRRAWRLFFMGGGWWRLRHDGGEGAAAGLSEDAGGYWAVHDVLDVRRPAKRKGQQLEILISWAAHDWAGRPWADEWQPITYLKRQRGGEGDALYVKARAMEAAKYATRHAVVREEGGDERRSPRLAEAHVAAA